MSQAFSMIFSSVNLKCCFQAENTEKHIIKCKETLYYCILLSASVNEPNVFLNYAKKH